MSSHLREWFLRLLGALRRRDSEIDEELRFHLAMAEEDALRRGESVRDARLRSGGIAQAAEAIRDQNGAGWLADFLRDSRHGIRLLQKTPLFTASAIVSLALGIGANTAIFSLIDAVILQMTPVHEPKRLVQFGRDLSYPLFRQFRKELHCFTDMFAQSSLMGRRDVIFDVEPETVNTEIVSSNYYSVLEFRRLPGAPSIPGSIRAPNRLRSSATRSGSAGSLWIRRPLAGLPVERPGVHDRWCHPARVPRRGAGNLPRHYAAALDGRRNSGRSSVAYQRFAQLA